MNPPRICPLDPRKGNLQGSLLERFFPENCRTERARRKLVGLNQLVWMLLVPKGF